MSQIPLSMRERAPHSHVGNAFVVLQWLCSSLVERAGNQTHVAILQPLGRLEIFPSPIYRRKIKPSNEDVHALNDEITTNFRRLMARDDKGIEYSQTHYAGGYTSYFSLPALQRWVPPIKTLEQWLQPHIREFIQQAGLQDGPELFMTDCWANVMGDGTEHVFHQHKKSTISGTYYVQTPRGCSGLLFEDPRLDRTVAKQSRRVVEFPAIAGFVILFESWQRHKVPPNCGEGERILGLHSMVLTNCFFRFHQSLYELCLTS